MHVQDRPPGARPPGALADNAALHHLRKTSGRLRSRLLALVLSAVGVPLLLALILGNRLATAVSGPFTLGMLVLVTGGLTVVAAALWYDRACRARCDPQVDQLRGRMPVSGPAAWERP